MVNDFETLSENMQAISEIPDSSQLPADMTAVSRKGAGDGFFLAREDSVRMFDHSPPALLFLLLFFSFFLFFEVDMS